MPATYWEKMAVGWFSLSLRFFSDLARECVFRGAHVRQIPGRRRLPHEQHVDV